MGAVALTMTLSSALRGEPMQPNRRRANLIDRDTIEIRGRPPDLARNIETRLARLETAREPASLVHILWAQTDEDAAGQLTVS